MTNQYDDVMRMLFDVARMSHDTSTQNAAVLLDENGNIIFETLCVNSAPEGVQMTPDRLERPAKYFYTEHAERNVIYSAAREGIKTDGLTLVAIWASCADCARAVIRSGINQLVRYDIGAPAHWSASIDAADEMYAEAEIKIINISTPYDVNPILHNGKLWLTTSVPPMN